MYGIKPVIIAIVVQALYRLLPSALKSLVLAAIGIAALILYLLGINELIVLFGGAFLALAIQAARRLPQATALLLPIATLKSLLADTLASPSVSLIQLFLVFLKVGALLYGSGYVLLAFLRNDLVVNLGWLTDQQLLDAIAIGQFTPGPVFTTATFIGYVLAGIPGAIVATVGIFLPSFCFVALLTRIVPHLRKSSWTSAFLDGVNVAALGLMAGVTWQLGRAAIIDVPTAILAVIAAVLLFYFKFNSAWLVLAGAIVGLARLYIA
jgi:chromate transporter